MRGELSSSLMVRHASPKGGGCTRWCCDACVLYEGPPTRHMEVRSHAVSMPASARLLSPVAGVGRCVHAGHAWAGGRVSASARMSCRHRRVKYACSTGGQHSQSLAGVATHEVPLLLRVPRRRGVLGRGRARWPLPSHVTIEAALELPKRCRTPCMRLPRTLRPRAPQPRALVLGLGRFP